MVDGYGLGGFGTDETYGSVPLSETVTPVSIVGGVLQGILEATSSAIGEADTEIGGLYMTRLTEVISVGETTWSVETTEGWGSTGKLAVDGVVYYYTSKTEVSFSGISHIAGGVSVNGAAIEHRIESTVVDISRTRSALEKLRHAMLVDYAEGEDLSVIGRNLAVNRLPVLNDDDQFRELIKVLAYNPKGTRLGITLVLEALVGVGNAEVYEFHAQYPNVVFIKLYNSALISNESAGKAFLTGHEYEALSGSFDTLTLSDGTPLAIASVRLLDLGETFSFRTVKPSGSAYPYYPGASPLGAFNYLGTETESAGVLLTTGSHCRFTSATGGSAYYSFPDYQGARVAPESYVEVTALVRLPATATLTTDAYLQFTADIHDGDYRVRWGMQDTGAIGLLDTPGTGFIGSTKVLTADTFYEVTLRKYGTNRAELWVDGELIDSQPYSAFTATATDHIIRFGIITGMSTGMEADWKQIGIQIKNNVDYWSSREIGTADVLAVNPNQLTLNGSTAYTFLASDIGKFIRISGSGITNAQGGNNNGRWVIDSFTSGTVVELSGVVKDGVTVSDVNPTRITVIGDLEAFTYPDDLGKQIVISGSSEGNDGTYVIAKLLQLGSLTDLATFDTVLEEHTNVCEVISATFASEVELSYKLMPNFADETNLDWEQSNAGSFSGAVITLRQALWANNLLMDIAVSRVLTGQILDADADNLLLTESPNTYEYYPFYLADPFALIKSYIDAITVSGVKPEYIIE